MEEVNSVGARRLEFLGSSDPGLSFEDDYMDTEWGTRGLIRVMDREGEVIALEFIEPEEMWGDPDAAEEYAETLEDGIPVTVIVPDSERLEAEALLREEAGRGIRVLSYSQSASASWH